MRWVIIILLSLFLILGLGGCWDRRELNDITFVAGMAIEKGKTANYEITLEVINASQLNPKTAQGNTPTVSFSLEGDTISEIDDKMNIGLTRQLDFSHTRTIVIDEALAREGVGPFLQYIERSAEFRNDFHLLIAKDVKAKEIIKTLYPVQLVPSMKLDVQLKSLAEEWGGYPEVRFIEFTSNIASDGRQPVAAVVSIEGDPSKGETVQNNQKASLEANVVVDGLAIFDEDKLIGMLSIEEARNYVWTQDIQKTTVIADCNPDQFFSVRIFNSHTEIKASYQGEQPVILIKLVLEGELQSTQCAKDETSKIKTFEKYEKILAEEIPRMITTTIGKVQEQYGVDIFGFGEEMERQQYKKFKSVKSKWNDEFKRAKIDVEAKVFIRRDGIRNESFIQELGK
ncbi:Ger(x)C family spore germination protein [Bacillus solitudinis]|uniref:Ger(x)C family spore germination protein n=1 Tax=Bacillus solitudinis TaxID=2014074 RepID=UPI000C236EB2|nr:Ger(x)C family spore germination protein [Bacillus solitudinis]